MSAEIHAEEGQVAKRAHKRSDRRRVTTRLVPNNECDQAFLKTYDEMLAGAGTNAVGDFTRRCILLGYLQLVRAWEPQDYTKFLRDIEPGDEPIAGPSSGARGATSEAVVSATDSASESASQEETAGQESTQITNYSLSSNNDSSPSNASESMDGVSGARASDSVNADTEAGGVGKRLMAGLLGQGGGGGR
ncbi:hypothetical protein ACW0US_17980 [Xanthomonas euvesicatoria]